jgi:hypothetical protein
MHFAENQLSPSLLGLSPLTTGHPPSFQPRWVRASTGSYPRFPLPMARSLGFGSAACDYDALFRLAFAPASPQRVNLATHHNSLAHSSKGTPSRNKSASTDCRPTVSGTISLPSRGTFHPHGTRALSVDYRYLALRDGPRRFTPGFTGPVLLGCLFRVGSVSYTGLLPSMAGLSRPFCYLTNL